ncbi:hypothetical protein AB0M29_04770 [Streptomyces sp. NPDC051976]|uniref:hypothetical protein n=1 Tax=Streptomyces sp. NPDC051976 TaxID=3154947 RepID=UPI0034453DF6
MPVSHTQLPGPGQRRQHQPLDPYARFQPRGRPRAGHARQRGPALSIAEERARIRPALPASLLLFLAVAANAGVVDQFWSFLDYGSGVLALVSLTCTVLWGLAATDRILLRSPHRLVAQAVHRGLAVAGLCFLALHIWVKVTEGHTTATAAAVPFTDFNHPYLIGLGTLSGYLFVSVAVTGAVRSAFTGVRRSRWWRALHMGAYPAWGGALIHGLHSGRPVVNGWVTAGYALCVAGVAGALALRLRGARGSKS